MWDILTPDKNQVVKHSTRWCPYNGNLASLKPPPPALLVLFNLLVHCYTGTYRYLTLIRPYVLSLLHLEYYSTLSACWIH